METKSKLNWKMYIQTDTKICFDVSLVYGQITLVLLICTGEEDINIKVLQLIRHERIKVNSFYRLLRACIILSFNHFQTGVPI